MNIGTKNLSNKVLASQIQQCIKRITWYGKEKFILGVLGIFII